MADEDCGGEGLLRAQDTAVELYQLAALLLGNEVEALHLVEETVSRIEVDPCAAPEEQAVDAARHQIVDGAVARMARTNPAAFVAPPASAEDDSVCIQDDDLSAAGISASQLAEMVGGSGSEEMRTWLDRLPPAQRAIFVQRAILGWDNGQTAAALEHGGGAELGWHAEQVSGLFRQALCSLANSLVHSAAHRVSA